MSSIYDPMTGLRKTQSRQTQSSYQIPGWGSDLSEQGLGVSWSPGAVTPGSSSTPQTQAGAGPINTGSYLNLLNSDPILQQTLADLQAGGISDRAQADTLSQRALIQFGEVPALEGIDAKLAGPDFARVAGLARPLAEANTQSGMSVVARMEKLRKDNVRAIKNALAARGALRSGEAGHQLGEEQQRFQQAQYDARSQLVDLLSGIEAGFANAMRQRAGQQAQAQQAAMQSGIGMFPHGVGGGGQTSQPQPAIPRLGLVGLTSAQPPTGSAPQRRYPDPLTGIKTGVQPI